MKNKSKNYLSSIISNLSSTRGFTLIELLVVMALLVSVGAIIGAILFAALRGTNKTNTLTVVRQNGNYAISQMAKTIRNANRFDGVSTNDVNYLTDCSVQTPPLTPTPVPASFNFIKVTSVDGGQTTFACPDSSFSPQTIASRSGMLSPISLLDTAVVSLVSCSITCTQASSSDTPIIGIEFSLSQAGTPLSEKTAQITFDTSIVIRNLPR